jgi:hypothetical protein
MRDDPRRALSTSDDADAHVARASRARDRDRDRYPERPRRAIERGTALADFVREEVPP